MMMNLSSSAVFAIALSAAASSATVSAYSFSAKASKASSKATKAKSPKTKASKGSYSMSMSLPNCKRAEEPYDTGSFTIEFDVNELVTPEQGETFTFFDYSSASANYDCSAGDETGIMLSLPTAI